MTILRDGKDSVKDASALALAALGWVLSDDGRAQRFLDLTGLTPDGLRDAIGEPSTHRAVFEFLEAHEPDLLGAADALDMPPEELVAAGRELRR
ncbi:DUF3572 family protein [Aurantiacibacter gangjinensis]|uniref:DUF3572 family protein n=1 Tax=Aurantiacibacter gangjinensis TaxID=502682 RepID=UPI00090B3818|nr:DUF3572 family protein [Aurantiacibacter gangjinensis]APE27675.1 hypothetical protein BMF35_a0846 [Aurantiacibacter gangjinensis]